MLSAELKVSLRVFRGRFLKMFHAQSITNILGANIRKLKDIRVSGASEVPRSHDSAAI